jgi:hypothetical protein
MRVFAERTIILLFVLFIILSCTLNVSGETEQITTTEPQSTATLQATQTSAPSPTPTAIPYDSHLYFNTFEIHDHLEISADEIWRPIPHDIEGDNHIRNVEVLEINPEPDEIRTDAYGNQIAYWTDIDGSINMHFTLEIRTYPFEVNPDSLEAYDFSSEMYQEYTQASDVFPANDARILALAAEIIGDETNPYLQAVLINDYVNSMECCYGDCEAGVLDYVEAQQIEDCGSIAWTIVTLLRSQGIPARTGNGINYPYMLVENSTRQDEGYDHFYQHVWAEMYIPNYGWVDLDQLYNPYDYRIPLSSGANIMLDESRFNSLLYFHSPRSTNKVVDAVPRNTFGDVWQITIDILE